MKLTIDGLTLTIEDGVTALVAADETGRGRLWRALAHSVRGRWDRLLLDERTSRVEAVEGPPVVMICGHRMRGISRTADRVVMVDRGDLRFDGPMDEFCTRPDGTRDDPESAYLRRLFAAGR